jgi:hypothetical protein
MPWRRCSADALIFPTPSSVCSHAPKGEDFLPDEARDPHDRLLGLEGTQVPAAGLLSGAALRVGRIVLASPRFYRPTDLL